MSELTHSVSVAGVTVDELGHVLVIRRRDNDHWEPPGGILGRWETPEVGVAREVLEETGVHVRVGPLTGVYKNMDRGVVALVYRCTPIGGAPAPTAEAADVKWVSREEVAELMTPAYAVRIEDAFGPHAASRHHDGVRVSDDAP